MSIVEDVFGTYFDDSGVEQTVKRYTLRASTGIKIQVISYGATISDVIIPDKHGKADHVVLGFDDIAGYRAFRYIGSTIGRFANRIEGGKFEIDGTKYNLTINNNGNHLHGGNNGWDKCLWTSSIEGNTVVFSHQSADGSDGYPGQVLAQVAYSLTEDGKLSIEFQATTDKTTVINMTNHSFFNLAGHGSGQNGLYEHRLHLSSDYYLPVNENQIPTGIIQSVESSPFNLRETTALDAALQYAPDQGFDHCFCVRNTKRGELALAVRVTHPPSGRFLEVYTTEPGVQLYTGNFLPYKVNEMVGRESVSYTYQGAICCEPQNYPNAVNETSFPSCILKPREIYKHKIIYRFGTILS